MLGRKVVVDERGEENKIDIKGRFKREEEGNGLEKSGKVYKERKGERREKENKIKR